MKKILTTLIIIIINLSLNTSTVFAEEKLPCNAQPGEVYVELNEALGSTNCIKGSGGVAFMKNYISEIYIYVAGLMGVIAVFSIVVGGIQLMVGGDGQQEEVKRRIGQSLAGIALLMLSGLVLYTINPTFFVAQ